MIFHSEIKESNFPFDHNFFYRNNAPNKKKRSIIFPLNNHFYTYKSLSLSCQQPPILMSELVLENANCKFV